MGAILAAISNLAAAVAAAFGYQTRRLDLRNSAAVQAAAVAQQEAAANDQSAQAIAKQDAEEVRKELAE